MTGQPTVHFLLAPNPIYLLPQSFYQIPALLANCVPKKALNGYFTPSTKNNYGLFRQYGPA
jgi:hypothetical protein